jgi:O-antigen ligase
MVVVVIAPFIGIDLGSFYGIGDARGPYGSHSLALCLSLGFIVALALCLTQKNRLFQSILLFFCLAAAISIARTYVRTGYLAFFTSLLVFTLFVWRYGKREIILRRYRALLSLIFIVIIGAFCVYSFAHAEDFRERNRDLTSIKTAGSGRMLIYRMAFKKYSDSSVFKQMFGGGLGDIYFLFGSVLKVPHNDYLVILLAGGLVGLALHFCLLLGFWRQITFTARATYLPLIIGGTAIATFAVATMTNPVIGYMSVMTYFSFLTGGAIGHYARVDQMNTPR